MGTRRENESLQKTSYYSVVNLNEKKTTTWRPINLIVVFLSILLIGFGVLSSVKVSEFKELKRKSNLLQVKQDSLLELVKISQKVIESDSLLVVELKLRINERDSLLQIVNNREAHYRNKWFATYKKMQDEKNNYNNSTRRTKDSLAAILAKRQY